METPIPRFYVGAVVHIVNSPITRRDGPGWCDSMSSYLERETIITRMLGVGQSDGIRRYRIEADGGDFMWSEDMFQEYYERDASDEGLDAEIASVVESLLKEFKVHETAIR